jgi:hypothetical protein
VFSELNAVTRGKLSSLNYVPFEKRRNNLSQCMRHLHHFAGVTLEHVFQVAVAPILSLLLLAEEAERYHAHWGDGRVHVLRPDRRPRRWYHFDRNRLRGRWRRRRFGDGHLSLDAISASAAAAAAAAGRGRRMARTKH